MEENFNSIPRLEVPLDVFVELLVNALIHRDYYQNSPIRLFIFDNRIEICSPGILPESVTEESIRQEISKPRNQLLFDNAKYLLPYTGIGRGIIRAMKSYDHISFENNHTKEEFTVTILRKELVYEQKSDYDGVYDGVYDGQILQYCLVAHTRIEIMKLIGMSNHPKNYENHIKPLLIKDLLAMTLPDKPKSKNQKYVTTEKGRSILKKK